MRALCPLLLLATTACLGGSSAHHATTSASQTAAPPPRFSVAYSGAPGACAPRSSYAPRLSPSEGEPGSAATISGALPMLGENGKPGAPSTKLAVWWNLRASRYFTAVTASPSGDRPGIVADLATPLVPRPNPCGYRISFHVPDVRAGKYPIVLLGFGGGGFTDFAPVTFTVR